MPLRSAFSVGRTLLLLVLVACGSENPGTDPEVDAGGTVTRDGAIPGSDAATASTFDAARPPRGDAGPITVGVWRDITPAAIDLADHSCTDLQFDPSDPARLYAMFSNAGLYRSEDSGANWQRIDNLPEPVSLGRVRIDPNDPMHLYVTGSVGGESLGFWVSHDGGATFAIPPAFSAGAMNGDWNYDVYNIAVDPTDFDHFILSFHYPWPCCGDDSGVVESTDGGATFVAHAPIAGMNHAQGIAFLYDPDNGIGNADTWLVGGGYVNGIYRTTTGGDDWTRVSDEHDNHGGFQAHYSSQGYVYIGVEGGILRSVDNGITWASASEDIPHNWYYGVIGDGRFLHTSMAFVGTAPEQPFLVSPEGGEDEGASWEPYSDQRLPAGPWRMVFEPENRVIYNATWNGGAWALSVGPL